MPACPQISVDRGLKWEEAYARSLELMGTHDGFYLSYKVGPPASPRRTPTGRALAGGPGGEGSGLHGPAHRGDHCPARAAQPQPHARPHAGPRQQAQLPAGPAEPRQALHRVQAQHRAAEPAGDLRQPVPEVSPGRPRRPRSAPPLCPWRARLLQPPAWPSTSMLRCPGRQAQDERAWGLRTSCSPPARWGAWTGRGPGAQPAVSTGDSGGGQRALGEQLHLLSDSLQPHHMVRAQGSPGGVGGGVLGGARPRPVPQLV